MLLSPSEDRTLVDMLTLQVTLKLHWNQSKTQLFKICAEGINSKQIKWGKRLFWEIVLCHHLVFNSVWTRIIPNVELDSTESTTLLKNCLPERHCLAKEKQLEIVGVSLWRCIKLFRTPPPSSSQSNVWAYGKTLPYVNSPCSTILSVIPSLRM